VTTTHHTAYPLAWPLGRPRTRGRERSPFGEKSFAAVRDGLLRQLHLLGAKGVVLSTNVELRQDGLPYAGRRNPDDPGAAVYFTDRGGRAMAFACDRWRMVEHNLYAILMTIDALRGVARWGTGDMQAAAFAGFQALPAAPADPPWWEVLATTRDAPADRVTECYRRVLMNAHPDRGGSDEATHRVQRAWDQFRKERGLT
jgi:hypothetical protein